MHFTECFVTNYFYIVKYILSNTVLPSLFYFRAYFEYFKNCRAHHIIVTYFYIFNVNFNCAAFGIHIIIKNQTINIKDIPKCRTIS